MKANLLPAMVTAAVFMFLLPRPIPAQWLNYKTPGIPRTPDGKPDLSAPVPRTADGKPDLSGIWRAPGGSAYGWNVAADLKPGDVLPWAEQVYKQRALNLGADSPRAQCLPDPPPYYHAMGNSMIVQTPNLIMIVNEGQSTNSVFRIIHTDGRGLPEDPNPTFLGYSVGHWEGDTMVVTTAGFNDRTWLDEAGHPHTEALRTIERFHRRDFGHMDVEMTIDDPKTFTKPFTLKMAKTLTPDTDILESICEDNDRVVTHLRGGTGFRLTPEILSKYTGTYELEHGGQITVTSDGNLLFLKRSANGPQEPFAAQSETDFETADNFGLGGRLEFIKDANGALTQFVLHLTHGGDQRAVRKGNDDR